MPAQYVESLHQILKLAIQTAWLEKENPVNLLLVSETGMGKSDLLREYNETAGIYATSYTSFSAFLHNHADDLIQGRIRYVMLSDFAAMVNRPRDSIAGELGAWNVLLEEGMLRYETRATRFNSRLPRRIGMIAATTERTIRHAEEIAPPGFLSRFLQVRYRYKPETSALIRSTIAQGEYRRNGSTPTWHPEQLLVLPNPDIFRRLLTSNVIEQIRHVGDTEGYRTQRALQTLLMAHAALNGRNHIVLEDLLDIIPLLEFFKGKFVAI